jgi:hypothetical protein
MDMDIDTDFPTCGFYFENAFQIKTCRVRLNRQEDDESIGLLPCFINCTGQAYLIGWGAGDMV